MTQHLRGDAHQSVRVLLIDDQVAVRHGLRLLFQLEPEVMIIGEAGTAVEGLSLAVDLQPDVVVMDVEMPGMDGITATGLLLGRQPKCRVIILTIHGDSGTRARALAAGAAAFVEKGLPEQLRVAFRQAISSRGTTIQ